MPHRARVPPPRLLASDAQWAAARRPHALPRERARRRARPPHLSDRAVRAAVERRYALGGDGRAAAAAGPAIRSSNGAATPPPPRRPPMARGGHSTARARVRSAAALRELSRRPRSHRGAATFPLVRRCALRCVARAAILRRSPFTFTAAHPTVSRRKTPPSSKLAAKEALSVEVASRSASGTSTIMVKRPELMAARTQYDPTTVAIQ